MILTFLSEDEEDRYAHDHDSPYTPPPMGANAKGYYPATNNFAPPPNQVDDHPRGEDYSHEEDYPHEYAPYNPADYPPPPPGVTPQSHGRIHDHRDERYDPNLGYPNVNDTYEGDSRYPEPHSDDQRYNTEPRGRRGADDVSSHYTPTGVVADERDPASGGCLSSTCP